MCVFVLLVLQTDEIVRVLDVLLQVSHLQLQSVALQLLFKLLHKHTHKMIAGPALTGSFNLNMLKDWTVRTHHVNKSAPN